MNGLTRAKQHPRKTRADVPYGSGGIEPQPGGP